MAWFKKAPDLTNNPLYLEPRVTAAESSLAEKANQSTADNIQSQVNAIVLQGTSGDSSAEMAQVRVDSDGMTFPTAKSHIDNIEKVLTTGVSKPIFADWVQGAIDTTTGANTVSTTRIRTSGFHAFPVGKVVTVKPETGYKIMVFYYDSSQVFVTKYGWATTEFKLNRDYPYYKFMIAKVVDETAVVEWANHIPFTYDVIPFVADGTVNTSKILDSAVTPKKTSFFDIVIGKNKFNKNNFVTGYYVEYNTANKVANANYGYMDYEEFKPNTLYTLNMSAIQTSFYDSGFNYISGHLSDIANRSFTTPSNTKYVIISIDKTALNTFMIVEGDTLGTYEAYTKKETINTLFLPTVSNTGGTLGDLIIVDINEKGHYTTITDAINAANDGDTIYVLPGVYRESIKIRTRNVNIVGFDKELCILKYDSPSYSNAPLDLSKGNISNMTIYAEKLAGAVAEGTTPYAVHIDAIESVDSKLTFNNCRLISDWNAGAGIGLMKGFTLTFNACELISNEVTNTNGGVFFHDAAVSGGYGKGNIIFNRSVIKSKSDIAIMPSSSGVVTNDNSVYMTFYNTMIYSDVNGKTTAAVGVGRPVTGSGWRTYNNFFLTADSYGNNQTLFNVV